MKRIHMNKVMKGLAAAVLLFGAASCSDDLDYELFQIYLPDEQRMAGKY